MLFQFGQAPPVVGAGRPLFEAFADQGLGEVDAAAAQGCFQQRAVDDVALGMAAAEVVGAVADRHQVIDCGAVILAGEGEERPADR